MADGSVTLSWRMTAKRSPRVHHRQEGHGHRRRRVVQTLVKVRDEMMIQMWKETPSGSGRSAGSLKTILNGEGGL